MLLCLCFFKSAKITLSRDATDLLIFSQINKILIYIIIKQF